MPIQLSDRIFIDPEKCNGKPIIRGQRITVQTVLELLSAGESIEALLQAYPTLEEADIYASLAYAAQIMQRHSMTCSVAA